MQKLDINHLSFISIRGLISMSHNFISKISRNLRELTTQITWHFTLKFHPEGDKFSYDDFSLHLSKTHQSVYYFQHRGSNPLTSMLIWRDFPHDSRLVWVGNIMTPMPSPPFASWWIFEPPPSHRSWTNLSTTNVWCILPCWHIQIPSECLFRVERLRLKGWFLVKK